MKSAFLLSVASAATLDVTWKDCGAKHAKITDVQPTTIESGSTTTLTGKGTVDESVTATKIDMTVSANGVKLTSCSGDGTSDISCKLPLGAATITLEKLALPFSGDVSLPVDVTTSSMIPGSLEKVDVHITASDQNGDSVICLDVHTDKAALASFQEIAHAVNSGDNLWTAQAPEKFESVESVKPYLGARLPGDKDYHTPDVVQIPAVNGDLPSEFDSATQWPKCKVIANVRDQSACGSCWAFGSTASFESRACISTGNDIKYSPEDTAFCSNAGMGCQGGNTAWDWFKESGVVTGGDYTDIGSDKTCLPYEFAPCAHHVPATAKYPECPSGEYPSPSCKRECSEDGYSKSYSADKVRATKTFSVEGEEQIMQELVTNGPMYVAFEVYSDFPTYKSGVYHKTSGSSFLGGHAVTLVGYGELDGTKYWKIKNSWNEMWGDNGHFLIKRGNDECGIESSVSAGLVSSSTVV